MSTPALVGRFAHALAAKLSAAEKKYGYTDGWMRNDWMDECRRKLAEHVGKGDPLDVAAYCAFLWHHGESTAPAGLPPVQQAQPPVDECSCPQHGTWLLADDINHMRQLDVAMNGEAGAAKQAKLCDLMQQLIDRISQPPVAQEARGVVTDEAVTVAARVLCNLEAEACGVNADDAWTWYSEDHKARARAVLEAAVAPMLGVSSGSVVPQWQTIETAPKSTAEGRCVSGIYILGYCRDSEGPIVRVVWWEPLMNNGKGLWVCDGSFKVHPTHWMPLPAAPSAEKAKL